MRFVASAAGSVMLFGEHAVLHGMQAVCCAIGQRMKVTLTPRADQTLIIRSALGMAEMTLSTFAIRPPFQFVLTAIEHYQSQITKGFDLSIEADFSSTMGLGSSSAVTVATVGVLTQSLGITLSALELFEVAKAVVVKVQGLGSGADVAAAVFGGMVAYRTDPLDIQPLLFTPDIVLVYSGAKMPTREVVQYVETRRAENPSHYQKLFFAIGACAEAAVVAIKKQMWPELGALMSQHHLLQVALGVSTPLLEQLVAEFAKQPGILGAKISGSGMGDCVIGLGKTENIFPINAAQEKMGVKNVPVKISTVGYQDE